MCKLGQPFLSKLLWKFPVKGCILMDSIYHQRRIFSKRINTLQCKAQRKDQHRKQKRQEIDPPSVSLFLFSAFCILIGLISFPRLSVVIPVRSVLDSWIIYRLLFFWNTVISFPSFFLLYHVFVKLLRIFQSKRKKLSHPWRHRKLRRRNSFFLKESVYADPDLFMGVIINFMWWVF